MIDQASCRSSPRVPPRRRGRQSFETGIDQIIVERGIVLQIDLGPAARDFVERRLGDEEVPASISSGICR